MNRARQAVLRQQADDDAIRNGEPVKIDQRRLELLTLLAANVAERRRILRELGE